MDGDPLAMPVLLELLDCNDQTTRILAIRARILAIRGLGNIGPPARSVVPRLLQLMEDSDPLIGEECRQALWQIDPEQAGLAGVSRPDWQRLFKEVIPLK
jgi:HEAT repeat protein